MKIDPITFEVLKHRLWQINDEQAIAIKTISASPIVVEGNDFNVGIFTSDGRLVTSGFGSTVHVGTMGTAIQGIMLNAGAIRQGDIWLTNDPFLGALHQNDVVVASPLYLEDELVLWTANVLHHPDVGGIDEGSFCINARNLYQEPPRYLMKIVDQGEWSPGAERTFVTNSRLPDSVSLDLRAQVASINVAQIRLIELIQEVGWSTIQTVMEESISVAEAQLRDRLRTIPDGVFTGTAYMDGDRVGSERVSKVTVTLTKTGDNLHFDYTGSDPQVDAAVNCTEAACWAGTAVPIYSFIYGGEIDWNDSLRNCVSMTSPPGTVVNASFPAPVSISTVGFRWLVTVAACQAVAKMLAASPEFLDRACMSWNVSSHCINLFAEVVGKRVGALLSDHRAGGAAARPFADGLSFAGNVTSFSSSMGNIEDTEWKLPVVYLFRRQLADSGGAGRWRGGLTAESALMPYEVDSIIYKVTNTAGTDQTNALGLWGGYPGAGSQTTVVRNSSVYEHINRGGIPMDMSDWGGELVSLPSKADGILKRGDILHFYPPGGGGWGDPLDREEILVAEDVKGGRVSHSMAAKLYGVNLDSTGKPDPEKTLHMRETARRERGTASEATWPLNDRYHTLTGTEDSVSISVGAYGEVTNSGLLSCARCGTAWFGNESARIILASGPLSLAGPWRAVRWGGNSQRFSLFMVSCPGCHTLIHVEERLTAEVGHGQTHIEKFN